MTRPSTRACRQNHSSEGGFVRKVPFLFFLFKVVGDPCQKITLLLLKSKSVRVIVPESFF